MPNLSKEQRKSLETTAEQYASHLPEAADWLAGRGIEMANAEYEGLGVVRNPPAVHEQYEGRLSIPYITDFGPVGLSFRCMQDHDCKSFGPDGSYRHGKYLRPKNQETTLYGVRSFDDATDWIAVCEGELDSFILRQIGIPAVAIPGASNWKDHWVNVFEDLSRIYVFADADASGAKLLDKIRDMLSMPVLEVKLPQGEDVNSTFLKYGADSILKRIKK
jgi:5S rRNA maturation endonuclease (ribonuclease M5)